MRLFIAFELDGPVRAALAEEIARLAATCPKIRWVAPENLHVTARFLGEVVEDEIRDVCAAMDRAAAGAAPFAMELEGLGCFPDPRRPRVVWAGVAGGGDEAGAIVADLEGALEPLGFDRERRAHHPHVTLGRVKAPPHARDLAPLLASAPPPRYGAVDVDALTLFMSERKKGGPRYSAMYRAPLGSA